MSEQPISARTELQDIEYRTLPEYEGYRFGSDGSVWSRWRRKGRVAGSGIRKGTMSYQSSEWKRLKPMRNEGGYSFVNLRKTERGIKRCLLLHQLVLAAFGFARPSGKHVSRHLNGVRTDNRIANLQWGTCKDNHADAVRHGTVGRYRKKIQHAAHEIKIGNVAIEYSSNGWWRARARLVGRITIDDGLSVELNHEVGINYRPNSTGTYEAHRRKVLDDLPDGRKL